MSNLGKLWADEMNHKVRKGTYAKELSKTRKLNKKDKLETEKQAYRNALENMGFCKRHICENCGYVKELPKRCVNEQIRDEVFHKQALEGE